MANTGAPNEVCSGYRWYGSLAASDCCTSTGYVGVASARPAPAPGRPARRTSRASPTRARRCGPGRRSRSTAGRRRSRGRTPWPRPRPGRTPTGRAGRSPGRCPWTPAARASRGRRSGRQGPSPAVHRLGVVVADGLVVAPDHVDQLDARSRPCTAPPATRATAVRDSSAHTVIWALGASLGSRCAPAGARGEREEDQRVRRGGRSADATVHRWLREGRSGTTRRRAAACPRLGVWAPPVAIPCCNLQASRVAARWPVTCTFTAPPSPSD